MSPDIDSTLTGEFLSCENTEYDYTDEKEDDIFSITMDEIQGCESFSEIDPEGEANNLSTLSGEEGTEQSSDGQEETSDDTSPDTLTETNYLITNNCSETEDSQEIDGYSDTTKSSCDIAADGDISASEASDTTNNQNNETDTPANTNPDSLSDAGTADVRLIEQTTDIEADSDSTEEALVGASPTPLKTFYNVVTDFGANGNDSAADEVKLR